MSGVAQRAGQVDIGAAAALCPVGRPPTGQITRADIRIPACHNVWSIWQEQYCHKWTNSCGETSPSPAATAAWGGPCGGGRHGGSTAVPAHNSSRISLMAGSGRRSGFSNFSLAPERSSTHGHRGRRAEPNAGAGTPGVRPHRMTRNTGRAQCAHTADPCNICGRPLQGKGKHQECRDA